MSKEAQIAVDMLERSLGSTIASREFGSLGWLALSRTDPGGGSPPLQRPCALAFRPGVGTSVVKTSPILRRWVALRSSRKDRRRHLLILAKTKLPSKRRHSISNFPHTTAGRQSPPSCCLLHDKHSTWPSSTDHHASRHWSPAGWALDFAGIDSAF